MVKTPLKSVPHEPGVGSEFPLLFIGLFFVAFVYYVSKSTVPVNKSDNQNIPTASVQQRTPRTTIIEYQVQDSDTVESLANKFDISQNTIRWANNITDNTLSVGSTIKILPVTGVMHTTIQGDSISSIAQKYKVDPASISNYPFNITNESGTIDLTPGTVIIVPDGEM